MLVCPVGEWNTRGKSQGVWSGGSSTTKEGCPSFDLWRHREPQGWCLQGSPQSTPQLQCPVGAGMTNPHCFSFLIFKLYTNLLSFQRNSIISFALSHFQLIPVFSEVAVSEKHTKNLRKGFQATQNQRQPSPELKLFAEKFSQLTFH